jgi:hypothetical protein
MVLCVVPLRLGGLRGKKSTPSIGWRYRCSLWISTRRKEHCTSSTKGLLHPVSTLVTVFAYCICVICKTKLDAL